VLAFYLSSPTKPDTGVSSQLKELLTTLNSALSENKFLVGVSYVHFSGDFAFCRVIVPYLPGYKTIFFPNSSSEKWGVHHA
jgi:hypothetical protein